MSRTALDLIKLDRAICEALKEKRGGMMTYVVHNILSRERGFYDIKTPTILRRLKFLERHGIVKRMPSSYAVQLCWALLQEPVA